jgi:hypothetical protein
MTVRLPWVCCLVACFALAVGCSKNNEEPISKPANSAKRIPHKPDPEDFNKTPW